MNTYEPKPHEKVFNVRPFGVLYECEFCNEGEMKFDNSTDDSVQFFDNNSRLFRHVCDKCHKTLMLPRIYPYIEWNRITDNDIINECIGLVKEIQKEHDRLESRRNKDESDPID